MVSYYGSQRPIDFAKSALAFLLKHKVAFLLVFSVICSLYTHWMVMREFHMPTYGNTMIHVASARHIIEHQEYPLEDYSYGGGIPNLYVPLYRELVANTVLLTGFSLDFTSRMLVLLFAVMVPLGFFLLGRKLFGTNAGILAAFLSVLPGELLIYTVRPLPQALGLILLPIAFHALFAQKWKTALFLAFAITMTHQEAIAFLVGGSGVFFGLTILFMVWKVLFSQGFNSAKISNILKLNLALIILAIAAYLLWQYSIVGHLNVLELAQFKNHEGNVVSMDSYLLKTGNLVSAFSMVGLVVCIGFILYYLIETTGGLNDDMRRAMHTFSVFLFSAFCSFAFLTNFSMNRNMSLISISVPFFLGPLKGFEIILLCLLAGLVSVAMVKTLYRHSEQFMKFDKLAYLFIFALFIAGLVAVKNDALPFISPRVFMDRFLVYLQLPLILLSALGADAVLEFLRKVPKLHLL
ncbi:MAG: hypothetical protein V1835_00190 [Candidatus Micrarchaeota archaeon]